MLEDDFLVRFGVEVALQFQSLVVVVTVSSGHGKFHNKNTESKHMFTGDTHSMYAPEKGISFGRWGKSIPHLLVDIPWAVSELAVSSSWWQAAITFIGFPLPY